MLVVRVLIVGHGGREAVLASRFARSAEVCAYMGHANPTLVALAEETAGAFAIGDVCDPAGVASFASEAGADLAVVSADDPLAAGVVDALLDKGQAVVGPTRAGAEIEWNKEFGRQVVDAVAPEVNPRHVVVKSQPELVTAIREFGEAPVAVKPQGLTGGKGVKVVGKHFADNAGAQQYAEELLSEGRHGDKVIVEERLEGVEFTIQAITDGSTVLFPPATYDYPYRFDGDEGPGTGGMGCFNLSSGPLPFVTAAEYHQACEVIGAVVDYLRSDGRHFNGVLNSGFFATSAGLRAIEFNARFGDPEALNILPSIDADWADLLGRVAAGSLRDGDLPDESLASVVVYAVAPEYAVGAGRPHTFRLDEAAARAAGAEVFFASAVRAEEPGSYQTVGNSRAVGFAATGSDLESARSSVMSAISSSLEGPLQWRTDIADAAYVADLVASRNSVS